MSEYYSRKPKPGFKKAFCSKCGKELKSFVPEDATNIVCFRCSNLDQAQ